MSYPLLRRWYHPAVFHVLFCTYPFLQDVNSSNRECLTSDLFKISDWRRTNLVLFNALKTRFLHLSTRHNFPDNYSLLFNNTRLSPSSTLNIHDLSFPYSLYCKLHIFSVAKTAPMKLSVLSRLRRYISSPQLLTLDKDLIRPCMVYVLHVWEVSTHTALLDKVESKAFRLNNSSPLTDYFWSLSNPQCYLSCYLIPLFSC